MSLERLQLYYRSCQVLSTQVDGQCDKLLTVVRHRVARVCQRQPVASSVVGPRFKTVTGAIDAPPVCVAEVC